ncbi:MAG: MarR family transcriptional regulator [Odoribacter sp.]
METLCKIRDIYRSISEFEIRFEKTYQLSLNEGMLLCTLSQSEQLTSGEIAGFMGLTTSNTSKVIRSVENKGLIKRILGHQDKRQMYFSITPAGREKITAIEGCTLEIPDLLSPLLHPSAKEGTSFS